MEASTALYFTSVQGMDTSPFAGSQEGLEGQISPRGKGNYEEIEQLWEDKWHGGLEGTGGEAGVDGSVVVAGDRECRQWYSLYFWVVWLILYICMYVCGCRNVWGCVG